MDYTIVVLTSILVACREMSMTSSQGLDYYGSSPLSAFDVSGHVDKSTTLRCQLKTGRHNRGWYVITWQRMEPDGTALPLVHLPVRHKIPEWSTKIPASLQARIQPIITVQPGHVEFNLHMGNLTCADEGEYRCSAVTPQGEILSAAELSIYASPKPPEIIYEYMPTTGPGEITVECKADVGLPPKMLVWYTKLPGARYFTIVDKQHDVIEETDGCHIVSTRTVDIIITMETEGTQYRCGYPGYIQKEGMFDEITIEMKGPEMEEVREDPKMSAVCGNGKCNDGAGNQNAGNPGESRNRAKTSRPCLIRMSILAFASVTVFYLQNFLVAV